MLNSLLLCCFVVLSFGLQTAITTCEIGRHTCFCGQTGSLNCDPSNSFNNCNGGCGFGDLSGPLGPGHRRIAAPNNYEGNGFGYRNGTACGVCYELVGPAGVPVVVMITTSCPDCPTLQAHFDLSSDASYAVDGAPGTQSYAGNAAVTWREVSCDFTGNLLVEVASDTSDYFMRLNTAHYRIRLAPTILVQETGKSLRTIERKSWGSWDFNAESPGPFSFPISVTVRSYDGQSILVSIPSTSPQVLDAGSNFVDPAPLPAPCPSCAPVPINNGQAVLYDGQLFPEQTGQWGKGNNNGCYSSGTTSQAWMSFTPNQGNCNSGNFPTTVTSGCNNGLPAINSNSAQCGSGTYSTYATLANFGCNLPSPRASVERFQVALKVTSGTGLVHAQIRGPNSASSGEIILTTATGSSTVTANWQWFVVNISNNTDYNIPDPFNGVYLQIWNQAGTYWVDDMSFVFPSAPASPCSPGPTQPNPSPSSPQTTRRSTNPTTLSPSPNPTTQTTPISNPTSLSPNPSTPISDPNPATASSNSNLNSNPAASPSSGTSPTPGPNPSPNPGPNPTPGSGPNPTPSPGPNPSPSPGPNPTTPSPNNDDEPAAAPALALF